MALEAWARANLPAPSHSGSPRLSHAPQKCRRLYSGSYGPFAHVAVTAHAQRSGHVMPVMAASVARGGVNVRFLLRAARGAWWSRLGGFWGFGEAAAPVTARKFRATGSRPAGEEEAGGPERPGDVVNVVFVDRSGQRIPGPAKLPWRAPPATCT
ncbi:ferredoxin-2, mitochondrial isoform X2 [Diceros bicornis minor]|uniref:ferredoxin-2, mitochondrial isoform X2 n=1 Tax=Diceros bicornis minor TaxID=77932 RepID=UPI0026EC6843|nr:ferredoxin-2, mitochondrial isoform X2 [Diceros bicornis minor]